MNCKRLMFVLFSLASLGFICFAGFHGFAQDPKAQEPEKPKIKLDEFMGRKGVLLVKNFFNIGELMWTNDNMKLKVLQIYEAGKKDQARFALIFEKPATEKYESTCTETLDFAEAESLVKALETLIDFSKESVQAEKEYMEVFFATEGDFKCGFFQKGTKQIAFMSLGAVGKTSIFGKIESLVLAKDLIAKSIVKLKELGAH